MDSGLAEQGFRAFRKTSRRRVTQIFLAASLQGLLWLMASRQSPRRLRIVLCPSKTKPNSTSSLRIDPRSHVSERKRTQPEHTQCKCVQISLLTADRLFFFRFKPHFISIIITVSYRSHSVYILIGRTIGSLFHQLRKHLVTSPKQVVRILP